MKQPCEREREGEEVEDSDGRCVPSCERMTVENDFIVELNILYSVDCWLKYAHTPQKRFYLSFGPFLSIFVGSGSFCHCLKSLIGAISAWVCLFLMQL